MKRKLVAIGVLAALALVIIIVNTAFKEKPKYRGSTCKQFLSAIEQGDAKKSYSYMGSDLKKRVAYDKWEKTVKDLVIVYGGATPELTNTSVNDDNGQEQKTSQEDYRITTGSFKYDFSCIQDSTGAISDYTSKSTF